MNTNTQNLIDTTPELHATASAADMVTRMAAAQELAKNPEVVREIKKYGKVPVVYAPTRAMMKPPQDPGLTQLISNAMTVQEVINLVKKGCTDYKNVSNKTVKKWKKAAEKRIEELEAPKLVAQ